MLHKFFYPKIIVKNENLYSIVAITEGELENGFPYARLTKRKDNQGEFVITRTKRKVYRKDWKHL